MEGVITPDGDAVEVAEVERQFAAAMAGAGTGDIPAPPPKKTPDLADDKPRARRGRPPKPKPDEKPRAQAAPVDPGKDYTPQVQSLLSGAWMAAALLPATQPYAFVLDAHAEPLAAAIGEGCKHNSTIRGWVETLSGGEGGMWMVQLGVAVTQMAMTGLQLARDPAKRAVAAEHTRQQLLGTLQTVQGKQLAEATDPAGDVSADDSAAV